MCICEVIHPMCRQFNKVMSKFKFQTSAQFEGAEYDKPWSYC